MKVKFITRITCLVLSVFAGYLNAFAQTDSSKLSMLTLKDLLSEKVTTASKTLQEIGLAPATVMVVTRDQIKTRGYQSLLDVLYDLPDVKVDDKMYSGLRNSITLRGIQGSEKFMVLLDGISISSPSGEAMPVMENYPVHFADQIEILFGPASALYGANALSGVINIITKKGPGKKSWAAEASTVGGTMGYSNTTLFFTKKLSENVFFTASGQYSYDKGADHSKIYADDPLLNISNYSTGTFNTIYGPFTPSTPVRPAYESPMESYNLHASLRANRFSFTFFKNSTKIPTAWGNNTHNAIFNKEVFMKQSVTTGTASFNKTYGKIKTSSTLHGSEYNLDPRSNYRNLYTGMEPAYKFSTHFMFRADQQLDYKHSDKLNLSGGLSYEKHYSIPQSADLSAPVNKNGAIYGSYSGTGAYYRPEGLPATFYFIKYNNVGSFLQTQYSPSPKFHLTLGARYDLNSRYGGSLTPRMGIVYMPSPKTTIKALYGSAFLAPTPSDAYIQYGSFETLDSGRTYH
jgi:outer membrane cobalamin receptor